MASRMAAPAMTATNLDTSALRQLEIDDGFRERFAMKVRISRSSTWMFFAARSAFTLRKTSSSPCLGEVGPANILDVGFELRAGETELGPRPFGDGLVAPALGAEFQFGIKGEFFLVSLLAFVERGHLGFSLRFRTACRVQSLIVVIKMLS